MCACAGVCVCVCVRLSRARSYGRVGGGAHVPTLTHKGIYIYICTRDRVAGPACTHEHTCFPTPLPLFCPVTHVPYRSRFSRFPCCALFRFSFLLGEVVGVIGGGAVPPPSPPPSASLPHVFPSSAHYVCLCVPLCLARVCASELEKQKCDALHGERNARVRVCVCVCVRSCSRDAWRPLPAASLIPSPYISVHRLLPPPFLPATCSRTHPAPTMRLPLLCWLLSLPNAGCMPRASLSLNTLPLHHLACTCAQTYCELWVYVPRLSLLEVTWVRVAPSCWLAWLSFASRAAVWWLRPSCASACL